MSGMASTTVTIDKSYFETLLRRAEFDINGDASTEPPVTISKAEHQSLLRVTQDHYLLLKALFRGGITQETINLLLETEKAAKYETNLTPLQQSSNNVGAKPTCTWPQATQVHERAPPATTCVNPRFLSPVRTPYPPDTPELSSHSVSSQDVGKEDQVPWSRQYLRAQPLPVPSCGQNTILFTNLPERTTYKHFISIIRGGRLIDVRLRDDRSATATFAEGAYEFFSYAKRKDLYMHDKRIELRWNDRQYPVHSNLANKLASGVSRNFVIRNAHGKLTEEGIREDMDHIHNLVIVEVNIVNGDMYISTNSVQNALFAKSCMVSRKEYKGFKIEWYADECSKPLPKVEQRRDNVSRFWKANPAPSDYSIPTFNRFMNLNIDGTEHSSSTNDEDDEMRADLQGYGVNLNWGLLN